MKRTAIPISILASEALIALLIAYTTIMLVLDINYLVSIEQKGTLQAAVRTALRILQLSWSVFALIGMPYRLHIAWYIARTASILIGLLGICGGVFVFIVYLLSKKQDPLYLQAIFWNIFFALYLFIIYYLLSRPSTVKYFQRIDTDAYVM